MNACSSSRRRRVDRTDIEKLRQELDSEWHSIQPHLRHPSACPKFPQGTQPAQNPSRSPDRSPQSNNHSPSMSVLSASQTGEVEELFFAVQDANGNALHVSRSKHTA